jgi:transcriptional regulator with XRE-family HTH domain
MEHKVHEGRNVKRFRELLGIKQEVLANELGNGWNQKRISLLEQKESIELPLLEQISSTLKIPVEAFQNFEEGQTINIINNTFHDFKDNAIASGLNYQCSFNPIDKMVELYERLLQQQKGTIDRIEKLIQEK